MQIFLSTLSHRPQGRLREEAELLRLLGSFPGSAWKRQGTKVLLGNSSSYTELHAKSNYQNVFVAAVFLVKVLG